MHRSYEFEFYGGSLEGEQGLLAGGLSGARDYPKQTLLNVMFMRTE
jgi:hypothetical protein